MAHAQEQELETESEQQHGTQAREGLERFSVLLKQHRIKGSVYPGSLSFGCYWTLWGGCGAGRVWTRL
jgi:hypothetical protein